MPPPPWYRRLAVPWGSPGLDAEIVRVPARRYAAQLRQLPVFRALVVPTALGLVFSLVSLVVGAGVGGNVRAWLPHRTHVVRSGETLSQIARGYGVGTWRIVYEAGSNMRRYPDPDRIPVGARLDLPYRAGLGLELPSVLDREWSPFIGLSIAPSAGFFGRQERA